MSRDKPRVWFFVACAPENPSSNTLLQASLTKVLRPQIISPPSLWVRALPNWARLRYQRCNNGSLLRGKLALHLTFLLVWRIYGSDGVPCNALTLVVPSLFSG